jgi:hypothetical protein
VSRGVVVIASAGDERASDNPVVYPAGLSGVIGVTASNQSDGQLPTAGYGSSINFVDLTAPGETIVSTWWHDRVHEYGAATGTNLATPHVAGVAALILSVNPTLAPVQVIDILQRTASDLGPRGPDKYFGWGLVNAVDALSATPHFLQVSPDRLIFWDDGQTINPPVAQIVNNTTGPGTWTAKIVGDAAGWLELSSPAGSTPSYVTVSVRRPSSQVCVRTGFIVVDSLMPEAVNSPRVIDVVLRSSSVCRTYYVPAVANGGEVK